ATDRLVEPRGNNALELYREVLALAPNHPEAAAGEQRVIAALEAKVVAALRARDPQAGAAAITLLQRAQPNHPRYEQLYKELIELSRSLTPPLPPRTRVPEQRATSIESMIAQPAPEAEPAAEQAGEPFTPLDESTLSEPVPTLSEQPQPEPISEDSDSEAYIPEDSDSEAYADALEKLALATRLRER